MGDISQLHLGAGAPKPSVTDALGRFAPLEGLQKLPQIPCARSSLLCGIASGAAIGSVQLLMRRGTYYAYRRRACMQLRDWYIHICVHLWLGNVSPDTRSGSGTYAGTCEQVQRATRAVAMEQVSRSARVPR